MRVLVLSDCEIVPHTGSGYVIVNFTEGLRRLGHEVDAYGPNCFERMKWMRPRANNFRLSLGMARFISTQDLSKYDVVEFWGAASWRALRWVKQHGPRSLLVIRHSNGSEPRRDAMYWSGKFNLLDLRRRQWLRRARESFLLADGVVTVCRDDARWLAQEGLNRASRIVAIEPGLSPHFLSARPSSDRSKAIGFCGTWTLNKYELIVASLPRVLRANRDWRLELVGVGADFRAEAFFPEDVLPQIKVAPFVYDKAELARLYSGWEIFMLPSRYESFGLVLAEAMACGCACVATRVGFATELTDGVEISHIEHNPAALEMRLRELIANRALRESLRRAAVERVARLKWDDSIARYASVLDKWREAIHEPQGN